MHDIILDTIPRSTYQGNNQHLHIQSHGVEHWYGWSQSSRNKGCVREQGGKASENLQISF
jgi:hypothetical protein